MQYISYGHSNFNINRFRNITNIPEMTKPNGGFWASRVDAEFGWKEWCIDNEYQEDELEKYVVFELSKDAKILIIDNREMLKDLPQNRNNHIVSKMWCTLDFEELAKEYDAIEVLISKDGKLYYDLYGWDCDSILIMNPDIVEFVRTYGEEEEEEF